MFVRHLDPVQVFVSTCCVNHSGVMPAGAVNSASHIAASLVPLIRDTLRLCWLTLTSVSPPPLPTCRRAAPSAEFSVDRTRHMTSFLTMLGPSPDWNVGLSAEDLCTKECGWVQRVVQDLIPWDAGTDSGVTYEVINIILILTVLLVYAALLILFCSTLVGLICSPVLLGVILYYTDCFSKK